MEDVYWEENGGPSGSQDDERVSLACPGSRSYS